MEEKRKIRKEKLKIVKEYIDELNTLNDVEKKIVFDLYDGFLGYDMSIYTAIKCLQILKDVVIKTTPLF